MDKKFKRSDFIERIFFREADGFIEMYRIGEELRFDGHNQYFLNHGVSRFCDINLPALLDCFGVKDLDALKKTSDRTGNVMRSLLGSIWNARQTGARAGSTP